MDNTKKPVFIHSQELEKYSYPPDSMFDTRRAAKTRELLISLGLLEGRCGRQSAPVPATNSELKNFHTVKYLKLSTGCCVSISLCWPPAAAGIMLIIRSEDGR